nr:TraX family protein [uncultured Criibacterium sp.]
MQNNLINKIRVLDGASLKWIAMLSMFLDHFNKGFLKLYFQKSPYQDVTLIVLSKAFAVLGRVAFPIFLFLLVEGFLHTRSKARYFFQMLIFAFISEVPFDMVVSGRFVDFSHQNMFFTLALAVATMWAVDMLKNRYYSWRSLSIAVFVMSFLTATYFRFDYLFLGILIPMLYYLNYKNRFGSSIINYIIYVMTTFDFASAFGFFMVNTYNGNRGKFYKWIGYLFYPAHLLLIGYLRMFVLNV